MLTGVYIDQEGEAYVYRGIVSQVEAELLAVEGKLKLIACYELPPEHICYRCGESKPWHLTEGYLKQLRLTPNDDQPPIWSIDDPCIFCGSSF